MDVRNWDPKSVDDLFVYRLCMEVHSSIPVSIDT